MRALDSPAAIALWGSTRVSRNREVLWSVLTPGHRVAPSWRAQCQRLLWLAQASATTGTVQVLVQAVLEERPKPPLTGPVGRALQDTWRLGMVALEGWWKWRLPGQRHHCTWLWMIGAGCAIAYGRASGSPRCRPWSAAVHGRTGASGEPCSATRCVMH